MCNKERVLSLWQGYCENQVETYVIVLHKHKVLCRWFSTSDGVQLIIFFTYEWCESEMHNKLCDISEGNQVSVSKTRLPSHGHYSFIHKSQDMDKA